MSLYGRTVFTSPVLFGTTRYRQTVACFTGVHAYLFGGALAVGGMFAGAALGAIIGFIFGFVILPTPEPLTRTAAGIAGAVLGAKIGAALGAVLAGINLVFGKCTCPGFFNYGFCICIFWWQPIPASPFIPLFAWPCPGECAVLVPPGCP